VSVVTTQRGIDRELFLACRTDGKPGQGTSENPFDAKSPDKLDKLLRGFPPAVRIHLAPGAYFTRGYWNGQTGTTVGWQPKPGWKMSGAGMFNTTLTIVDNNRSGLDTGREINMTVAVGADHDRPVAGFELSDLTIDCNLNGQPVKRVNCGAVALRGPHAHLNRVRAINFGSLDSTECFVLASQAGLENAPANHLTVEDCIVEQPAKASKGGGTTAIILASGTGVCGVVRGNYIEGNLAALKNPTEPDSLIMHGITTALDYSLVEGNFIRAVTDGWYADAGKFGRITIQNNIMDEVLRGVRVDFFGGPDWYKIEQLRIMHNQIRTTIGGRGIELAGHDPLRLPEVNSLPEIEAGGNSIVGDYGFALYHCGAIWVHGNRIRATQANRRIVIWEQIGPVRVEGNLDENLFDDNTVNKPA